MTVPSLKVRVVRKPNIKVKVLPKFPGNVTAVSPIVLDRTGGNYTFSLNIPALGGGVISPLMDGIATVGISTLWAHEDHIHPSDTTRAQLASPAFTGTPTAPTPAVNDNSTKIATTAFVVGQAGTATPLMDGTAAVGTSLLYARQDHVHATDTATVRQLANTNLVGGTLAGNALSSSTLNILIGPNAGKLLATGTGENVVIGSTAGQAMTTGTQNTIVGAEAGAAITSDTGHTLIGYQAGLSLNGAAQTWNTFIGHAAGFLATGAGGCIAIGRATGRGFLNDVDCVAVGHAAFFYNNGGACTAVTAVGNQAAGAPVDGTGTNFQGTGLTYWGAINDTNVLYMGSYAGKSSAAARSNASAIGNLARLPLKDNTIVLGHGITAVETLGGYWDGWGRVDTTGTVGLTITAAQLLTGLVVRSGTLGAGVNDTTDTAANIVATGPGANCEVPCSIERSYGNNTTGGFNITIVGGTGVALSGLGLGGVIAPNVLAKFRIQITTSTPGAEAVTLYRVG